MGISTRRTILAALGFAPVSVVGAETFNSAPDKPGETQSVVGAYERERYAKAFEALAVELRRDAVEPHEIKISSTLQPNSIADMYEMIVRFRYKPEV